MKYEIINEKDAPAAPVKKSDAAIESESIVKQLGKGKVAKVEPDEWTDTPGLACRIGTRGEGGRREAANLGC